MRAIAVGAPVGTIAASASIRAIAKGRSFMTLSLKKGYVEISRSVSLTLIEQEKFPKGSEKLDFILRSRSII
jgi:hypothetical protein